MSDLNDLLDGPPRHLERYAPPWATDRRTICGRPLADVTAWLSFEDGRKLVERVGRTRAALIFCQTCVSQQGRINKAEAWERNPVVIVNDYTRHAWGRDAAFEQTRAEFALTGPAGRGPPG